MAWSSPKSWTTGYKVLASDLNTFLSDNDSALRAGGIAIASQAVGDIVYGSSSTQLGRIAAVATGQVLTSAGTGTVPAWSSNLSLGGTLDVAGAATFNDAGADVNLRVETSGNENMLFVDGGNNRVGIGTDAPAVLVHAYLNDTSVLGSIVVDQDGTGDASTRYVLTDVISWSTGIDNSDSNKFKISQSSNLNDSNRLIIDTSGNVGINASSPGARLDIAHGTGAQPATSGDVATNTALRISNTGSNNTVLDMGADSSTNTSWMQSRNRGNLGSFGSYVYPIRLNPNGGDVRVGAGVTFNNDTAAANTLDDYEEGTWSPVPNGSTGSAGTAANNMNGNYTKVGRLVTATCYGYFTNLGSWTGAMQITGLPFTHAAGQVTQGSIGQFPFGTAGTSAGSWRTAMFPAGGTHINFRKGANMDVVVPFSDWSGTGIAISVTVTYYA